MKARRRHDATIPEASPVDDHAVNGAVEQACQAIAGLFRLNKSFMERKVGGRLGSTLPMLIWLIEYV